MRAVADLIQAELEECDWAALTTDGSKVVAAASDRIRLLRFDPESERVIIARLPPIDECMTARFIAFEKVLDNRRPIETVWRVKHPDTGSFEIDPQTLAGEDKERARKTLLIS